MDESPTHSYSGAATQRSKPQERFVDPQGVELPDEYIRPLEWLRGTLPFNPFGRTLMKNGFRVAGGDDSQPIIYLSGLIMASINPQEEAVAEALSKLTGKEFHWGPCPDPELKESLYLYAECQSLTEAAQVMGVLTGHGIHTESAMLGMLQNKENRRATAEQKIPPTAPTHRGDRLR